MCVTSSELTEKCVFVDYHCDKMRNGAVSRVRDGEWGGKPLWSFPSTLTPIPVLFVEISVRNKWARQILMDLIKQIADWWLRQRWRCGLSDTLWLIFGLLEDCGWARPAHRRVHHTSVCNFKLSRFVPMSRVLQILQRTKENLQGYPCASSATLKYPHSYAHNDLQWRTLASLFHYVFSEC